jgi:hypothetical protein
MNSPSKKRSAPAKKTSNLEQAVKDFIKHVLDARMTIPARAASALNYFAEKCPYAILPYNFLLQAVMGYDRRPPVGGEEVRLFRGKMTATSKILHEKYGRGRHSVTGVGVRATVDDADRLVTVVPRKGVAAIAAAKALSREMSAIDIKKVPNTPELKAHRDWYLSNSKNILTDATDLINRLLPPGKKTDV